MAPTGDARAPGMYYPDSRRSTQVALGRSLHGKFVRFLHESKVSRGYLVTQVNNEGMIELQGFSGLFAPHLVERVDHPHTAAAESS